MLVSVLASGSKGNCTLVETSKHKILIDAGTNVKYIEEKLKENNVLLKDIDYILLSHTHTDHTSALNNLIKKYEPTIIMTELMFADLKFLDNYDHIMIIFDDLEMDGFKIESIKTSHDTSDSRGFIITEGACSVVQITDTGYLNQKYFNKLKNKNVYIMESNHDVEMLMHGKYPKWLKSRVLSDVGHLSNESSSYYLSKLIGPDTKEIILAHLSEENNAPSIALETIRNTFADNNIDFDKIIAAKQNEKTELISV